MAEFNVAATTNKARLGIFDVEPCIVCYEPFPKKSPDVHPHTMKLESLFSACIQCQDDIGQSLLDNKTDILNGVKTSR